MRVGSDRPNDRSPNHSSRHPPPPNCTDHSPPAAQVHSPPPPLSPPSHPRPAGLAVPVLRFLDQGIEDMATVWDRRERLQKFMRCPADEATFAAALADWHASAGPPAPAGPGPLSRIPGKPPPPPKAAARPADASATPGARASADVEGLLRSLVCV